MSSSQTLPRTARWSTSALRPDDIVGYALLLATVVLIAWAVFSQYQAKVQRVDALAARLAGAAAQDVTATIEQFDRTLQAIVSRHQSPALQSLDAQARNAALFERVQREPYFAFIDVLDEKGHSIAGLPHRDRDWSEQDYFKVLERQGGDAPYIGRRFAVESEKYVGFTISRRITDDDGRFAGLVVMGVRLGYFRELLNRARLETPESVMLLRDDGVILMRLPFDLNAIGDAARPGTEFLAAMQAGKVSVTAADPVDHMERRFAFQRIAKLPLVIGIGTASGGTDSVIWWILSATLTAAVGTLLLSRARWREFLRRTAAERESREKSRFLTTLSHELRTPLHGILGYAESLARETTLRPEQSQQVSDIISAGKHMRDVVNVVLDYARIEALGPAVHMRRIKVRDVVEECLALVEPAARARGLETRICLEPETPSWFVTDEIHLRQILTNLLNNAVKYTSRGKVELRVTGDEHHRVFEVIDTGIGIPEGQRHQLFKEYERFGAERTGIEGTGLGLAIAHRLARRMGGNLGHRNNPGGGSVFWLELPAGAIDEPEVPVAPESVGRNEHLNVLVVDDSEVNRAVAAAYLRAAGHVVTETEDASEAVRLAGICDFDVVLMDMRMTGMDGLEATRRIRALSGSRGQVPIIAVTANALDQHAEECRTAGMSEHLAKPFTQAELMATIRRATVRRFSRVCDLDTIAQVGASTGEADVQRLLDCLGLRIEALLRKLEDPMSCALDEELAELAHELIGSAGTLGFARLASAASRFEREALTRTAASDELHQEAVAALAELCRLRSRETVPSV